MLHCDKGRYFFIFNKDVQAVLDKHGIKIYTTENEEKSSIVERWNRTIKENLFKHVSASNSTQYLAVLPKIVNDYNLSKHRAIKMSPVEAKYGNMKRDKKKKNSMLEIRLEFQYKRKVFDKGYTENWTEDIFIVDKIQNTDPVKYKRFMNKKYKKLNTKSSELTIF